MRGHFWLVFVFVVPIVIAAEALSGARASAALELLGETFVGDWVGATIADLLTAPLYALGVVVLYFELRGRALGGPPTPPCVAARDLGLVLGVGASRRSRRGSPP